ncbi:hypothetical protein [Bacillus wiedmannii]|uniref:hypothetical protein n=1 Tax=Bacillus wiedmannii TaxID=1890302 RepID=UPI00142EE613|nr:hypothetical protein [Bacillus wiedmannii]
MSTLATCNACRREFEKGLDNCPTCGRDQRSFLDRYKMPIFVGVILILGMVMGATGG